MKKIILIVALSIAGLGAYAAGFDKEFVKQEKTSDKKDCVLMENGTMFVVKDGKKTEMLKAVIMSNGTKVLANGVVYLKDGTSFKLSNGDLVYMNGKVEKKP